MKRVAPNAHTFPEIIKARYGYTAHKIYVCFGLATNIIVTSMLLLGGAGVANALTGMNIYAACFLIPVGCIIYVLFGGLRATFLTDFVHTAALFTIILIFGFTVYATSDMIGSPSKMFDLLNAAVTRTGGVVGNAGYSYTTMASSGGAVFGIINIVGNFGTVFVDQAYWQRAFAARPSATVVGYLVGGLCWFSIPFFLATTLGLAGVALENDPKFPTYPTRMTGAEVGAGLVAPYAAVALMGPGGAAAILILVFLAVTSAASAELIAVSSLLTYDVYRTYFNPEANGRAIINMSHMTVIFYGLVMGGLASALQNFGITLGYLYLLMGIIVAPAVIPIAFTLTWSKQSTMAAIISPLVGVSCGIATWVITASQLFGAVNLETTGANYPMLAGNLMSLLLPFFITVPISMWSPQSFDFEATKEIGLISDEADIANSAVEYNKVEEEDPEKLNAASRFAYACAWALTVRLYTLAHSL